MEFFQENQGQGQYQEQRPGFTEQPMTFSAPQQPPQGHQAYTSSTGGAPGQTYQNQNQNNGYSGQQQQRPYSGNNSGYSGGNKGGSSGGGNWNNGSGYQSNNRGYGGGAGGGGWKGKQQKQLTPEELANLKLPKSVAITGNARAPDSLRPIIAEIAAILRQHNMVIRASGMDGFDRMVLDAVPDAEIHLPWKDFGQIQNAASTYNSDECKEYAKRFLPEWSNIKDSQQAFYCKNVRLVLGRYLKQPCQITIIWSEDGCEGPTTRGPQSGQAGHIAALSKAMNIPVINISNPNAVSRLRQFLES